MDDIDFTIDGVHLLVVTPYHKPRGFKGQWVPIGPGERIRVDTSKGKNLMLRIDTPFVGCDVEGLPMHISLSTKRKSRMDAVDIPLDFTRSKKSTLGAIDEDEASFYAFVTLYHYGVLQQIVVTLYDKEASDKAIGFGKSFGFVSDNNGHPYIRRSLDRRRKINIANLIQQNDGSELEFGLLRRSPRFVNQILQTGDGTTSDQILPLLFSFEPCEGL